MIAWRSSHSGRLFFLVINSSVDLIRVCRIFHKIRFVQRYCNPQQLSFITRNNIQKQNSRIQFAVLDINADNSIQTKNFVFKFNSFFIFFHTSSAQTSSDFNLCQLKKFSTFIFARCAIAVLFCLVGVVSTELSWLVGELVNFSFQNRLYFQFDAWRNKVQTNL